MLCDAEQNSFGFVISYRFKSTFFHPKVAQDGEKKKSLNQTSQILFKNVQVSMFAFPRMSHFILESPGDWGGLGRERRIVVSKKKMFWAKKALINCKLNLQVVSVSPKPYHLATSQHLGLAGKYVSSSAWKIGWIDRAESTEQTYRTHSWRTL